MDLGAVDEGPVGGVEVGDGPSRDLAGEFDGKVLLGDAGVFDGEIVALDDAADADQCSGVASKGFALLRALVDGEIQLGVYQSHGMRGETLTLIPERRERDTRELK